jgi:hypothetical protein
VVHCRRDVGLRVGERLAIVQRFELGELSEVRLDRLGEAVDQAGPLRGRQLPPRPGQRLAGCAYRPIDVIGPAEGDLDDRLAGGWVDRLELPAVGGLDPLAADHVRRRAALEERPRGVGKHFCACSRHPP